MSYCRWSSDDFGCDVYAYESAEGFTVHVAEARYVGDIPKVSPMPFNQGDELWTEWFVAYEKQTKVVAGLSTKNIGLEYDRQTFVFQTLQEFLDGMLDIQSKGYNVPEWTLESIRQEISDGKEL